MAQFYKIVVENDRSEGVGFWGTGHVARVTWPVQTPPPIVPAGQPSPSQLILIEFPEEQSPRSPAGGLPRREGRSSQRQTSDVSPRRATSSRRWRGRARGQAGRLPRRQVRSSQRQTSAISPRRGASQPQGDFQSPDGGGGRPLRSAISPTTTKLFGYNLQYVIKG